MKKPLLSVVIPMYNSKDFILSCLKSVTGYDDSLEVIIVDDGSHDNSIQIVKEYLETHKGNIRVLPMHHQGLSLTRLTGVKEAKADYIAFLDSDDEMNVKNYLKLLNNMKEHDVEVGIGRIRNGFSYVLLPSVNIKRGDRIIDLREEKSELCSLVTLLTCKIWKKSLLKYYDTESSANEDIECVPYILAKAQKVFYTDDVIYYRISRDNSVSALYICDATTSKSIRNTVYPLLGLKKRFMDHHLYVFYQNEIDAICMKHFFERIFNIRTNKRIINKEEVSDIVLQLLNILVPNFLDNPYFKEKFPHMEINDRLCYYAARKKVKPVASMKKTIDELITEYGEVIQLKQKKERAVKRIPKEK